MTREIFIGAKDATIVCKQRVRDDSYLYTDLYTRRYTDFTQDGTQNCTQDGTQIFTQICTQISTQDSTQICTQDGTQICTGLISRGKLGTVFNLAHRQ